MQKTSKDNIRNIVPDHDTLRSARRALLLICAVSIAATFVRFCDPNIELLGLKFAFSQESVSLGLRIFAIYYLMNYLTRAVYVVYKHSREMLEVTLRVSVGDLIDRLDHLEKVRADQPTDDKILSQITFSIQRIRDCVVEIPYLIKRERMLRGLRLWTYK
jgi:hypothetical protein